MSRRLNKKKDNLHDQIVDFSYWCRTWKANMSMMMKYDGRRLKLSEMKKLMGAMDQYPWMGEMMKLGHMFSQLGEGRYGASLEALWLVGLYATRSAVPAMQNLVLEPENTVFVHTMVPNEIFQAMGLKTTRMEQAANSLTMASQHAEERYLDAMYSRGLLENTCTYSTQTPGMVLSGNYPKTCKAIIAAAMPCEAHFEGYSMMIREMQAPAYWLDLPYDFNDDRNMWAYVEDLKGMIAFLEKETGHTMDWEKLRYYCENHNKVIRAELERWDYNASNCPTITDDAVWLSHLQSFHLESSTDEDVVMMEKITELARKAYERKEPCCKNLLYRTVFWSTPLFFYPYFWKWLEECWGVVAVMDMETFGEFTEIDTDTPDTMLHDLAVSWCHGTMSRHLRGPAQNWIDGLDQMVEIFRPDFVINLNHNNCRGHLGMTGYLSEWSRRKKMPVCNINENFYDARICSRQGVRDQVNAFMTNVIHAEPLRPELMVFDDENDW